MTRDKVTFSSIKLCPIICLLNDPATKLPLSCYPPRHISRQRVPFGKAQLLQFPFTLPLSSPTACSLCSLFRNIFFSLKLAFPFHLVLPRTPVHQVNAEPYWQTSIVLVSVSHCIYLLFSFFFFWSRHPLLVLLPLCNIRFPCYSLCFFLFPFCVSGSLYQMKCVFKYPLTLHMWRFGLLSSTIILSEFSPGISTW